jgi:hypothetical protein
LVGTDFGQCTITIVVKGSQAVASTKMTTKAFESVEQTATVSHRADKLKFRVIVEFVVWWNYCTTG